LQSDEAQLKPKQGTLPAATEPGPAAPPQIGGRTAI
jgi:hypothetical protein